MADKELLELAAKAAGLIIDRSETSGGGIGNTGFDALGNAVLDWHDYKTWNPLTDDGDAFRLAMQLGMLFNNTPAAAICTIFYNTEISSKTNPAVAARLAIVLAAAEIGKSMKQERSAK